MEFHPSITPIDAIKFYKNSWKEFEELRDIDKKYYSSDFYDLGLNYYKVEVGIH